MRHHPEQSAKFELKQPVAWQTKNVQNRKNKEKERENEINSDTVFVFDVATSAHYHHHHHAANPIQIAEENAFTENNYLFIESNRQTER